MDKLLENELICDDPNLYKVIPVKKIEEDQPVNLEK